MKKTFAMLLVLVMMLGVLPVTAAAAVPTSESDKVLFDLKNATSLSDLAYLSKYNSNTGDSSNISASLSSGKLTLTNDTNGQGMVRLFDDARFAKTGSAYKITAKFTYASAGGYSGDATRAGIVYNMKAGAFTGTWTQLRATSTYKVQSYVGGSYDENADTDGASLSNHTYSASCVYTVTAQFFANDTYSVRIEDANGVQIGLETGMLNNRSGSGVGVFVRGATMTVSEFVVTESKELKLYDVDSAFDTYDPENGKKIFDLREDVKSAKDIGFIQAFNSSGDPNTKEVTAEFENGALVISNEESSYGIVNLFDYEKANVKGNKYVVSMTFSLNRNGASWSNSSNGVRGGIAFNVKEGTMDGHWANFRCGRAEQCEIQYYKNGTGSQTKATIGSGITDDVNEYQSLENTEYTVRLIFPGDGTYSFLIYDENMKLLSAELSGSTDFENAPNFGVYCRNAKIVVWDYAISEFNEDRYNCIRYIGVQSPTAFAVGDSYAVRFVAGLQTLNAETVGMNIKITTATKTKTTDYPVTAVYNKITASNDIGMSYEYTAKSLSSNYLLALSISGIPADAGDVAFTVTPYYVLNGRRAEGQSYTVIYNAGRIMMHIKERGAALPFRHEGTDLRLMTNNILYVGSGKPAEPRVELLAQMYETYSPDFISLQEVTPEWHKYLPKYMPEEYALLNVGPESPASGASSTVEYNANVIYYRKDRFEVLETKCFTTISFVDDDELTYGVFKDKNNGKIYIVFSIHWLVNGRTEEVKDPEVADTYRQASAKKILETISSLKSKYNTEYAFVMGDFNAVESTQSYKDITAVMKDSKYIATVRGNTTSNTSHTMGQMPRRADCAPQNYDYILVNGNVTTVLTHDIITNEYALNSSDHCPAYADVKLK